MLLTGTHLETNFRKILIKTCTFSFKKMHLKMLFGKCQPFCLSRSVLKKMLLERLTAILSDLTTGIFMAWCLVSAGNRWFFLPSCFPDWGWRWDWCLIQHNNENSGVWKTPLWKTNHYSLSLRWNREEMGVSKIWACSPVQAKFVLA